MKKLRKFNLKQREQFLIIVSVIGVVGSVLVYGSFARQVADTTKTGTYAINKVTTINNSTYTLYANTSLNETIKTKGGLTYCVLGWNSAMTNLTLQLGDVSNQATKEEYTNTKPSELICVKSKTTNKNAQFILKTNKTIEISGLRVR